MSVLREQLYVMLTFLPFLDKQQAPTTTKSSSGGEAVMSARAEKDHEKKTDVTVSPKDVAVTASLQIQPTQCQRGNSHN